MEERGHHENNSSFEQVGGWLALVEKYLLCPITRELMTDPVICEDGQTYERAAIEQWFRRGNLRSPATNATLRQLSLFPNIALRSIIHDVAPESLASFRRTASERRAVSYDKMIILETLICSGGCF